MPMPFSTPAQRTQRYRPVSLTVPPKPVTPASTTPLPAVTPPRPVSPVAPPKPPASPATATAVPSGAQVTTTDGPPAVTGLSQDAVDQRLTSMGIPLNDASRQAARTQSWQRLQAADPRSFADAPPPRTPGRIAPVEGAGETQGLPTSERPGTTTPTVPTPEIVPTTQAPGAPIPPRPVALPPQTITPRTETPLPPVDTPQAGSMAGDIYTPGDDARLGDAQGATDVAGRRVQSGSPFSARAGTATDRYRSVLGSGQVQGRGVDTDVPFTGVDTEVEAGALDPNARFRSIDTNITSRGIDPRVAGGPDVNADESGRYLAEQDAAVAGLQGPSRTELASQALKDFDTQGEAALAGRFRKVGQTAAKFGRMGMGDVNAELGSIQGDFERDRMTKANELARSVAEGDISDRFRRVDTTSGLRRGESGIESGLRGEARTERDYDTTLDERNVGRDFTERDFQTEIDANNIDRQRSERDAALGVEERNIGRQFDERGFTTNLDERNLGRAAGERDTALSAGERAVGRRTNERDAMLGLDERNVGREFDRANAAIDYGARDANADIGQEFDQLNAAGSLEDRIAGQGRQNRDEFRTERGYQGSQTQQTLENRLRQREMENAEREAQFRRSLAQSTAGRA